MSINSQCPSHLGVLFNGFYSRTLCNYGRLTDIESVLKVTQLKRGRMLWMFHFGIVCEIISYRVRTKGLQKTKSRKKFQTCRSITKQPRNFKQEFIWKHSYLLKQFLGQTEVSSL